MEIKVIYDGKYPNLCSGELTLIIDGKTWAFGDYCLSSGGSVSFDENWSAHVDSGPWTITKFPEGFPEDLKASAINAVNWEVPHGCCGGCV